MNTVKNISEKFWLYNKIKISPPNTHTYKRDTFFTQWWVHNVVFGDGFYPEQNHKQRCHEVDMK